MNDKPILQTLAVVISLGILLFGSSSSLADVHETEERCLEGVCFPSSRLVGDTQIPLIGITRFRYLLFDVYTVALYGPQGSSSSEQILADVPKSLTFHYHRDIERDRMIKGAGDNLDENPNVSPKAFDAELKAINALYQSVSENDRYTLEYEPSSGTTLAFNGQEKGTIPGKNFAQIYFGIWLSEAPLSERLRDDLLNGN